MTDDCGIYREPRPRLRDAQTASATGMGEYGRGEVHTNTVEGYFSIFKRGMKGVYQHCGKQHLHRYAAEFDSATTTGSRMVFMTPPVPRPHS